MALSRRQLAEALRLTDGSSDPSGPVNDILGRLEGVSAAFIELLCPNAPDAIKDEIEVRFVGYLYDMPTAGRGDFYGNAWRNSGAGGLASRWIVRRAGVTAELATDSSGETVSVTEESLMQFLAAWTFLTSTEQIPADRLTLAPGGMSAPDVLALFAAWTIIGNVDPIPADKFPFAIPNWLSDPVNQDIPFSLLESTLAAWTASTFSGVISDDVLPVTRFLPSPAGVTDGKIAKVVDGAWAIADDEQGTGDGGGGFALTQVGGDQFVNMTVSQDWYDTGLDIPAGDFFFQCSTLGGRSGLQAISRAELLETPIKAVGDNGGLSFYVLESSAHPTISDQVDGVSITTAVDGSILLAGRRLNTGDFQPIGCHLKVYTVD